MDGKELLKTFGLGAVIGLLLSLLVSRGEGLLRLCSNAFFFGGMLILLYALFGLTLYLGFYNGVVYSFKKLKEAITNRNYSPKQSKLKSRPEYEKASSRRKPCREHFLVAGSMLLASALIAVLG